MVPKLPTVIGVKDSSASMLLATESVREHWASRVQAGTMTPGSAARYGRVFAAFGRYVGAHCIRLHEVDVELCTAFIYAPCRGMRPPAASTSRFRLTVIRDAFAALIAAGALPVDSTATLRVAQVAQERSPVPLSPAEAQRLRAAGRIMPRDHLRPATVELALVGASHMDVARTSVADLHLSEGRVCVGSRWAELDPFASATLAARVAACRRVARRDGRAWDPASTALALNRPLESYPETSIAPGISSGLSRALAAAGITRAGVRPASIREYAANRAYALSGRVEAVAELLGLDSLDGAAGFVDADWQHRFAGEVRQ
jgi:integrase